MKNKVNNKDDGDSTCEETKSDSEISTKLPLTKYYLNFFRTWDRNSVPIECCAT